MIGEVCSDNRFEVIARAKKDLLKSTNIETRQDEMAVLDNILFRCWQMGWLDRYEEGKCETSDWISVKDRPLENNKRVLVYRPGMKNADIGAISVQWGWTCSRKQQDVSYWAPLPKPPKEE